MNQELFAIHPAYTDRLIDSNAQSVIRERHRRPEAYVQNAAGERFSVDSPAARRQSGAVAVLPLWGTLGQHQDWYTVTSTEQFAHDFRKLDAAPGVGTIVILTDSPGGNATYTLECSDCVYAARKRNQTRIIQAISSLSASAAEWIGTSAHERVATPSGTVGSIGVLSMYFDQSRLLKDAGVDVAIERTPNLKARFSGIEPATEEMRAHMKVRNQQAYHQFVSAVARNRGVTTSTVIERYGNGETMTASEAFSAGYVDAIGTVDEVVADAVAGRRTTGRKRTASLSPEALARRRRLALVEVEI
jgi:ClpP class serine protease